MEASAHAFVWRRGMMAQGEYFVKPQRKKVVCLFHFHNKDERLAKIHTIS